MTTQELYAAADGCDPQWRNTHRMIGQHISMEGRACLAIMMAGFADETSGDVEAPTGSFFRVGRWVMVTDTQGFHDLRTFETEYEARRDFERRDNAYGEWVGDDEDALSQPGR